MSKEQSDDQGTYAVSSGVLSDLSAAYGRGSAPEPDLPTPHQASNGPRIVGRGGNRRTRENDEPRFTAHHRAGRAGTGRI